MSEKSSLNAKLALVAAGGNLPSSAGLPYDTLRMAMVRLNEAADITVVSVSRLWSTPAFPPGSGPEYVNCAAVVKTTLSASSLLGKLHEIEAEMGRTRHGERWQARGIDLDLIGYEDSVLPNQAVHDHWRNLPPEAQSLNAPDTLILPHPRMQDRGFVLAPLAEIAPGWCHPRTGQSVAQMLAALPQAALAGIRPLTT